MDRIFESVRQTPPFTRYWCMAMIVAGSLTHFKVVNPISLAFIPEKTFNGQPWRLVTSFCYHNVLSFELFLHVWIVFSFMQSVEEGFITKATIFPKSFSRLLVEQKERLSLFAERNKTVDFLYFIVQIWATIVMANTYGYYKFNYRVVLMGDVLDGALVYIYCRTNPNLRLNLFGMFELRAVYMPLVNFLMAYVTSGEVFADLMAVVTGDFVNAFRMFKEESAWAYFLTYGVAHFWWFLREMLVPVIYHDHDSERSGLRDSTMAHYGAKKHYVIREALVMLLLPPWYWVLAGR